MAKIKPLRIADLPPSIRKVVRGFQKELLAISPYVSVTVDVSVTTQAWKDEKIEEGHRCQMAVKFVAHSPKKSKKHRDIFAKIAKSFKADGWKALHKKQPEEEAGGPGSGTILYKNIFITEML